MSVLRDLAKIHLQISSLGLQMHPGELFLFQFCSSHLDIATEHLCHAHHPNQITWFIHNRYLYSETGAGSHELLHAQHVHCSHCNDIQIAQEDKESDGGEGELHDELYIAGVSQYFMTQFRSSAFPCTALAVEHNYAQQKMATPLYVYVCTP